MKANSGKRSPNISFGKNVGITFFFKIITLLFGIITYILIARFLGPQGKGVFTLAILLPAFVVMFANFGIGPASVFYTAKQTYPLREILGNNFILALLIGMLGMLCGMLVIHFLHNVFFKGVTRNCLFLSLALIPAQLVYLYFQNILLGAQHIKAYNMLDVLRVVLNFCLIVFFLWVLKLGVPGAIYSWISAWVLVDIALFFYLLKVSDGISFRLNVSYLKNTFVYGVQAHVGNILGFLNYRVDLLLVDYFLSSTAVGYYSVAVELVERLWLLSQAVSIVLFPKVASDIDKKERVDITPVVARSVFMITLFGGIIVGFISKWLLIFLYTSKFLPAWFPMLYLLPGVVVFSAARILANDLAGRNRVLFNVYAVSITVAINLILNLLWIPHLGINGAALASSVAYILNLILTMGFYSHFSGNPWQKVIFPQQRDWKTFQQAVKKIIIT